MRWYALDVDYEMSGKDLIDSVRLSSRICRILGAPAARDPDLRAVPRRERPADQQVEGQRPVGRGMAALRAAGIPGQFMYNAPQRAKRLYFDVIPRAVDEYLANAARLPTQPEAERPTNPAWHIHAGRLPNHAGSPVSFAMLLNLASVVNADTPAMLWGFIRRYSPAPAPKRCRSSTSWSTTPSPITGTSSAPRSATATPPTSNAPRWPTLPRPCAAWTSPGRRSLPADAETIQNVVYEVGKRHPFPELRAWFACLYQVLLGQQEGPRFGGFIALYGVAETIALIEAALTRPADAA